MNCAAVNGGFLHASSCAVTIESTQVISNKAKHGGAMFSNRSTITFKEELSLANTTAEVCGGTCHFCREITD